MPSVHSMRPPDSSATRFRIAYPYSSPSERIPSTSGVAEAATRSLSMRTCPPYIDLLGILPRSSRYQSGNALHSAEALLRCRDSGVTDCGRLSLGEGTVRRPHAQRVRERLLALSDRVGDVHVEEPYVLKQVTCPLAERRLDVGGLDGRVDDQRDILLRHRPRGDRRHRTGAWHKVAQQVERELGCCAAGRQSVRLAHARMQLARVADGDVPHIQPGTAARVVRSVRVGGALESYPQSPGHGLCERDRLLPARRYGRALAASAQPFARDDTRHSRRLLRQRRIDRCELLVRGPLLHRWHRSLAQRSTEKRAHLVQSQV